MEQSEEPVEFVNSVRKRQQEKFAEKSNLIAEFIAMLEIKMMNNLRIAVYSFYMDICQRLLGLIILSRLLETSDYHSVGLFVAGGKCTV